jgi:hypothetical protein
MAIFGLGAVAIGGITSWSAWERGDWATAAMTIAGLLGAIALSSAAYLRFSRRELHDPRLVQEKLSREACRAEVRLAVIAPTHATSEAVRARLDRLAAAYRSLRSPRAIVWYHGRSPLRFRTCVFWRHSEALGPAC